MVNNNLQFDMQLLYNFFVDNVRKDIMGLLVGLGNRFYENRKRERRRKLIYSRWRILEEVHQIASLPQE